MIHLPLARVGLGVLSVQSTLGLAGWQIVQGSAWAPGFMEQPLYGRVHTPTHRASTHAPCGACRCLRGPESAQSQAAAPRLLRTSRLLRPYLNKHPRTRPALQDAWVHGVFWSAVVCYLLFLLYLVLTPERVARWLCWLTGGRLGGEDGVEPGALGYYAGAAVASPRWTKPAGAFGAVAAAGAEGWEAAEGGVGEEEEEQLEETSVVGGRVVGEVVATYTVRRGQVTRVGRSLSDTLPPSVLGQPLSPRFGGEDGLGLMRPGSADHAASGGSGRGEQAAVPRGQPGSELQQPLLEAGPSGS